MKLDAVHIADYQEIYVAFPVLISARDRTINKSCFYAMYFFYQIFNGIADSYGFKHYPFYLLIDWIFFICPEIFYPGFFRAKKDPCLLKPFQVPSYCAYGLPRHSL